MYSYGGLKAVAGSMEYGVRILNTSSGKFLLSRIVLRWKLLFIQNMLTQITQKYISEIRFEVKRHRRCHKVKNRAAIPKESRSEIRNPPISYAFLQHQQVEAFILTPLTVVEPSSFSTKIKTRSMLKELS